MMIPCIVCGKKSYKRPSHLARQKDRSKNFCSYKCRGDWQKGDNNPSWIGGKTEKICEICGKHFFVEGQKRKTARFCSTKCYGISQRGENNQKYNSEKFKCDFCGKYVLAPKWQRESGQKIYCSRACADKAQSERITRDGNPNWWDGIGKLPWGYEFTDKLKSKIKKRDLYKCRLCGENEKILIVHHINYDKLDNSGNNLITLCEKCHGKTGYNRDYWQKRLSSLLKK